MMEILRKASLIIATSIVFIYTISAIIELRNQSSKTLDAAFEKYINNEFLLESNRDKVGNKEFYKKDKIAFVPYEYGDKVYFAQFYKGIFGWRLTSSDRSGNGGYSYSSDVNNISKDIIVYGVIPEDIVAETTSIIVNGTDADIIMLDDKKYVWVMMNDKKENFSNVQINFLDQTGNVVAVM